MEERKGFGTNFGFLMASVGSAVGLGNIWGFPNKMGASGGFTFLIVYLILAVLCGFIIMDTLVALMAGLCVIPGRFALDPTGTLGGPKLLFITMQNVFSRMGSIGPIFGILFYLLVVFAAISSSISLLEAVVAHFVDKARDAGKGDKRKSPPPLGAAGFFLSPMRRAAPV